MRFAFIALPLMLAGCATPEYVASFGTFDLCRATMGGPYARLAEEEAKRRNLDCTPLYPAIAAQQAAMFGAGMRLMQMGQPQPLYTPQIPQETVRCYSTPSGNGVATTCR